MRTFVRGAPSGSAHRALAGRGGGAGAGRLPDRQAAARAALLRPAHPADPDHLLRRQHLALSHGRSGDGDGAREPGPVLVRGGPEAPRRAAHLRQLSAAAAAAQGVARGRRSRSRYRGDAGPERDPPRGRQADRRQLGRLLRAQALARQRRQPRRRGARAATRQRGSAPATRRCRPRASASRSTPPTPAYQTFVDDGRCRSS